LLTSYPIREAVVSNPALTGGEYKMSDEDLFVITNIFVAGKNLHKLLRASAGLVVKMDVPRPVINAVMEKGAIRAVSNATGIKQKMVELIRQFGKGTEIPSSQIKTLVERAGGAPGGSGYYTQMLKNEKILKLKQRGLWTVI